MRNYLRKVRAVRWLRMAREIHIDNENWDDVRIIQGQLKEHKETAWNYPQRQVHKWL